MDDINIKVSITSKPDKPVQIRFDNAIHYPVDKDRHYFVSDTTKHLKLRILKSAIDGKPEGRSFVYDYYWQGKRKRYVLGQIAKDNTSGITPPKARELVIGYEALRKQGNHPLQEKQQSIKEITLNSHFEEWKELTKIKPHIIAARGKLPSRSGGLDPSFYKQQLVRYDRHIRNTIGTKSLVTLTTKEIEKWFGNISKNTETESLKCLNLAKQIVIHLLNTNEELERLIPNRFKKIDQSDLNEKLKEQRQLNTVALEHEEFKALWNACDEWHNPVEGLFVKFVMASALRGKNVAHLKLNEIVKLRGRYQIRKKLKKPIITVRFTKTMEDIYKEVLKARNKYPQPKSGYLFPRYEYSRKGSRQEVVGVLELPMTNDNMDRIYKGKNKVETNNGKTEDGKRIRSVKMRKDGGIRGIAMNTEPTVGKYGLHDIRNTYSTMCESEEERARILGHTMGTVAEEHYTDSTKASKYYDKFADKREEYFLHLVK